MFERLIKISYFLIFLSISFIILDILIDYTNYVRSSFENEILEITHPITHVALFLVIIFYFIILRYLKKAKDSMIFQKDETIKFIKGEFSASVISFLNLKGLTSAEADVAYLIIKGLSYNEIANQRGSSVNTIRNQASNIFKKLDCSGRSEFVAIIFDDIL